MLKLTYAQAVTYKAVAAIESLHLFRIQPSTKILVEFLSGKSEKPNHDFYVGHKELYGCLPKANVISMISACSSLVEMGYLSKTCADGVIFYHTTGKNPFFTAEVPFSEKISAKNRELLKSIRTFVKDFCPPLRENDEANYFGFKLDNFPSSKNYNWFWITTSSNSRKLQFKIRTTPDHFAFDRYFDFDDTNAAEVADSICEVLSAYAQKSGLFINREAKYISVVSKPTNDRKPPNSVELDFSSYAGDKISKIIFNSNDEHMNALLSIGEASPFYYDEKTYFPSIGAREIAEGKRNFDFAMRKWKLVAWSVSESNPNLIKNALILSKKSKSIWIVLNVPDRRVVCVSLNPFRVSAGIENYSSSEIITKLFPAEG